MRRANGLAVACSTGNEVRQRALCLAWTVRGLRGTEGTKLDICRGRFCGCGCFAKEKRDDCEGRKGKKRRGRDEVEEEGG